MFLNMTMLINRKWIFQYINLHKKIYEMENMTTIERTKVAYEKYKSNRVFDIEEEDVIEKVVEEEEE